MKLKKIFSFVLAASMLVFAGCNGDASSVVEVIDGADGPTGVLVADGKENTSSTADQVLNIFTWATYFPDDILAEFTQKTGIKINYSTFESNEEMLMKLQAGGEYDLVLASDYIIDIARNQNLLKELDQSKIPNFKNINPAFQNQYYDPENKFTVPYAAGIPLMVYNPELVDFEVTGYADLWNPALADSVVVMDDMRNVVGMTLKMMGKSLNETDPAVLAQAEAKLIELRPNIRALDYNTPYNLMISGETAVGYMFTSQAITAIKADPGLKIVYPKEGLGFGIDSCFIPSSAPHADNAYKFLDFILDGEKSAQITDQIFYGSCNSAASEYLLESLLSFSDEQIKGAEMIRDVGDATDLYTNVWTKFKG